MASSNQGGSSIQLQACLVTDPGKRNPKVVAVLFTVNSGWQCEYAVGIDARIVERREKSFEADMSKFRAGADFQLCLWRYRLAPVSRQNLTQKYLALLG